MELKIKSNFMKGIVSRIVRKIVKRKFRKKLNIENFDFQMNDLEMVTDENGQTSIHLDISAKIDKEDLEKLVNMF